MHDPRLTDTLIVVDSISCNSFAEINLVLPFFSHPNLDLLRLLYLRGRPNPRFRHTVVLHGYNGLRMTPWTLTCLTQKPEVRLLAFNLHRHTCIYLDSRGVSLLHILLTDWNFSPRI
jgi:hypothetical protein